jgi:hypothetical protein
MFVIFFAVTAQVTGVIKEKAPYMLRPVCTWKIKNEGKFLFPPGSIKNEKDAINFLKGRYEKNYTEFKVRVEYEKCIGYVIEVIRANETIDKFMICNNGYLYEYEKFCKKKSLIEAILETFKSFGGKK